MQICNYTSQDSDHFVATFHQTTEIVCWFDGYRDLFHFLLHISSNICMHLCVSRRFVSVPCPAEEFAHTLGDRMSQYLPKQELNLTAESKKDVED